MKAYVLTYRGDRFEAKPWQEKETFPLEQLQDIVGGYIEIVPLTSEVSMVVNEEGKFMDMVYNEEATKLFKKCYPKSNDFIVGNVLVCESEMLK